MDIACDVNTLFREEQGTGFRVQGPGARVQKEGAGKPVMFVFALPVFGRLATRIS